MLLSAIFVYNLFPSSYLRPKRSTMGPGGRQWCMWHHGQLQDHTTAREPKSKLTHLRA